jgi:hypothetical protein
MDRVHSAVNWWPSSGPWWTKGGADKRHGGVSPVRGVRALGVADARWGG